MLVSTRTSGTLRPFLFFCLQIQHLIITSSAASNSGDERPRVYVNYSDLRFLPKAAVVNHTYGQVWRDNGGTYNYTSSSGQERPIDLRHLVTFLGLTDALDDLPHNHDSAFAALLALEHFNTRNSTLVPELAMIDWQCPSLRFTMEFFDTEQSPIVASDYVVNDLNKRPVDDPERPVPTAIIGPDSSVVASPVALMSNLAKRPVFSHSATSTSLDLPDYPLFGRVVPSLQKDATTAVDFMKNQWNIRHFSIYYVRDDFGMSYTQELQNAAKSSGVSTCIVSAGAATDVADPFLLRSSIERLKQLCGEGIVPKHFDGGQRTGTDG